MKNKTKIKYVILANSTVNKGEKVALVDRTICKTQWWTNDLDKIMIFDTKELADKTIKSLKFASPFTSKVYNGTSVFIPIAGDDETLRYSKSVSNARSVPFLKRLSVSSLPLMRPRAFTKSCGSATAHS
jgi:hypothetical protein